MTNAYMTHAAYIYGLAFSGVSKGLEERSIIHADKYTLNGSFSLALPSYNLLLSFDNATIAACEVVILYENYIV